MSIALDTHLLLKYEGKHRVLICRECRYAIQKSALESHLLRHKIYRGERRRLLSSIARLDLLETDDVQLPPAGSLPVHGLPIVAGYRCTAVGCESLYASSKRMKRHWSETHGESDPAKSFALSVNLQTFFRGTKLRYFEVSSSRPMIAGSPIASDDRYIEEPSANLKTASSLHLLKLPCSVDLETLSYFHHFTARTSLTLSAEGREPAKHWQSEIVSQALRLRWLMSGLLAISASHLSVLSNDEQTKRVHQLRSGQFHQEFLVGWKLVKLDASAAQIEEAKAGAQIICAQRLYQWTLDAPGLSPELIPEPTIFTLQSFTASIRGCSDPDYALRSELIDDHMPKEPSVRARNDLDNEEASALSDALALSDAPFELLERLRTLPYRMAEVLDKPDRTQDFVATMVAIDALVECCSLSYASNDVRAVWMGMGSWIRRLSDHFNQMVLLRNPAALIVFAHWSLLVKRAEYHCWFLRGLATKALRQIMGELPGDPTIRSLVEGLFDFTSK